MKKNGKSSKNIQICGYCFGILNDDNTEFVSIGYVSDIHYNAGNIIIYTIDNFRNNGYGKAIVSAICKECRINNIIPIYWVEKNNYSSIKLASAVGFKINNKEIVFATEKL